MMKINIKKYISIATIFFIIASAIPTLIFAATASDFSGSPQTVTVPNAVKDNGTNPIVSQPVYESSQTSAKTFQATTPAAQTPSTSATCDPKTNKDPNGNLCYIPLEPNVFIGVTAPTSNLSEYLADVFNFGIAVAVTIALIQIIWGGILYMTTDAWQKKEDGKAKIHNSLWGLGIALVSWLILWTINPCLVTLNQNATSSGRTIYCENTFLSPLALTKKQKDALLARTQAAADAEAAVMQKEQIHRPIPPSFTYFNETKQTQVTYRWNHTAQKWVPSVNLTGKPAESVTSADMLESPYYMPQASVNQANQYDANLKVFLDKYCPGGEDSADCKKYVY